MPVYSLKKEERLRSFDTRGKKWKKLGETEHFQLLGVENDSNLRKFGVAAGRKTGKAVKRNRIKRVAKEFFRQNKEAFPPGKTLLIRVKKIPDKVNLKRVEEEFFLLLGRREENEKISCGCFEDL
ncbi:MAG: ribonuclease P protein component [Deltaproteobacteria bacterium]|nr:ribonuclease P protein component [Deltaproteobacteria bacterium]